MTSILHANLPSEDEEDETFNPDVEELQGNQGKASAKRERASRRGLAASANRPSEHVSNGGQNVALARSKAKAASLFERIRAEADEGQRARKPTPTLSTPQVSTGDQASPVSVAKRSHVDPDADWMRHLGLAPPTKRKCTSVEMAKRVLSGSMTVSRAIDRPKAVAGPPPAMAGKSGANSPQPALREQVSKGNTEALPDTIPATWRAAVGDAEQPVEAGTSKTPVDTADERMDGKDATTRGQASASAAAEAAEAALKAIKDGAMRADAARRAGMVTVKETRRFAGQDVEIAREVKAGSKQAVSVQQRAEAAKARTGIDAVLSHIQGPRKANVMDKTADDWKGFRSANAEVDDELHAHQKSGDKYLEKKAFLQKAELSVYEQQRQAKIAARR